MNRLVSLLTERDNGIRYRAKIELSSHPSQRVVSACDRWIESLDAQDSEYEHHLLEALWVHQHHHVVNEPLLRRLLGSEDHRVRAAAAQVLRAWREDVADVDRLIEQLVRDDHPRVRLAGVQICSDADRVETTEMALQTAKLPRDRFLEYALTEAVRTLAPIWKQALAAGRPICRDNPDAVKYLLKTSSPEELVGLGQHKTILEAILVHPDTETSVLQSALTLLSEQRGHGPLQLLLDRIVQQDDAQSPVLPQLAALLAHMDTGDLSAAETRFLELAVNGKHPATRQASLAALARIEPSIDRAWQLASGNHKGIIDLLKSIKHIPSKEIRAQFYERVHPLMMATEGVSFQQAGVKSLVAIVPQAIEAMASIPGHESQKLEDLMIFLENDQHRHSVVATVRIIGKEHWHAAQAERLVAAIIEHAAGLAPQKRMAAEVGDELQLAREFADLLPDEQRRVALETIQNLTVQVLHLATIPHRMAYDHQTMVAKAGSPVRLVLDNPDEMPHNFVLTRPGALMDIGLLAEAEATQPEAIARQYVPESEKVLVSSRLLQPRDRQVLEFTAPSEPGIYPYVCTYPGHWRRMFGALYVVKNVEQYQQNPKAYLASNSLKVCDQLLKFNRPLKDWTFEELKPQLDRLAEGRSFQRGRELFQIASCGACHTVGAEQSRFAPDLTQLDPKRKPDEILLDVLEPSKTINEKYQTSQFLMDSGKQLAGMVVEETRDEVKLIVDPLASCEPVVLLKSEIEERFKSEISLMPSGLLDRLTEEEIMELCAYVVSRGDSKAPVYDQVMNTPSENTSKERPANHANKRE